MIGNGIECPDHRSHVHTAVVVSYGLEWTQPDANRDGDGPRDCARITDVLERKHLRQNADHGWRARAEGATAAHEVSVDEQLIGALDRAGPGQGKLRSGP